MYIFVQEAYSTHSIFALTYNTCPAIRERTVRCYIVLEYVYTWLTGMIYYATISALTLQHVVFPTINLFFFFFFFFFIFFIILLHRLLLFFVFFFSSPSSSSSSSLCLLLPRYDGDQLRSRELEGALIHDADEAAAQAVNLASHNNLHSICVHGDSPDAVKIARAVRKALEGEGFLLRPFCPPVP